MLSLTVKLPDLYTDWRLVTGIVLTLLGAGNWVVGLSKTRQYSEMIAATSDPGVAQAYRSFDELDQHSDRAVLEPLTAEARRVSYATARMDYYHVTFLAGRVMFALGLVITMFAFLAAIRGDARRALRAPPASPSPSPGHD